MRTLSVVLLLATIARCDESCAGIRSVRPAGCSQAVVLRVPSDGTGTYNMLLNASMPIYTNQNMQVLLENEREVRAGVADHLIYVISHPYCGAVPRITYLRFNDRLLCQNPPYEANANHPATQLYHTSTHFGERNHHLHGNELVSHNHYHVHDTNRAPEVFHQPNNNNAAALVSSNPSVHFYTPEEPPPPQPAPPVTSANGGGGEDYLNTGNVCGVSASAIPLIINGAEVRPGEFPWLGGLFQFRAFTGGKYICTVNLVTRKHLLSAAHCFGLNTDPDKYFVLLGHQTTEPRNVTWLQRIDVHPNFRSTDGMPHDVAVLTMRDTVQFTNALRPICLWQQLRGGASDAPETGTVAGFAPDYKSFNKVQFPIVTNNMCRGSHDTFHQALSEFGFCAGSLDNSGPCRGDSGAGFMQLIRGRYYVRGLVSASLKDATVDHMCDLKRYIIFADLTLETEWLQKMMK